MNLIDSHAGFICMLISKVRFQNKRSLLKTYSVPEDCRSFSSGYKSADPNTLKYRIFILQTLRRYYFHSESDYPRAEAGTIEVQLVTS